MVAPMRLALIRLAARVFETRMSADSIKVPLDLKWWWVKESHLRSPKAKDLQSPPRL